MTQLNPGQVMINVRIAMQDRFDAIEMAGKMGFLRRSKINSFGRKFNVK
jgi:hypothetical protein